MESSVIESKKHEESCGIGEQALKSVGEACVKYFSDMSEYVCSTSSTSPCAYHRLREYARVRVRGEIIGHL